MKLCIRAHDLGVTGTEAILSRLRELEIDGVQMVCYKAYDDIPYECGAITAGKAAEIGRAFSEAGKIIPMVGAYFNPVHSDRDKTRRCEEIFAEYLAYCRALGCGVVGSETGSFNDDSWTYNPKNRTDEALQMVVDTFSRLCDTAAAQGSTVDSLLTMISRIKDAPDLLSATTIAAEVARQATKLSDPDWERVKTLNNAAVAEAKQRFGYQEPGSAPAQEAPKPKFCPNCGAPYEGGKFCQSCGSKLG